MFNRIERNRASAAKIALLLDEATVLTDDAALLTKLVQLKCMALDSRSPSRLACRADRNTLQYARRLLGRLQDCAETYEVLPLLQEIEQGLFSREQTAGDETSRLAARKRMLLARCRSQAGEIDVLEARRRQIAAEGANATEAESKLLREAFIACSDRLKLAQQEFDRTLAALRAMDSVLLLRSEEETVAALAKEHAHLPDPDALEEDAWRTEIRRAQISDRVQAIDALRKKVFEEEVQPAAVPEAPAKEISVERATVREPVPVAEMEF